MHFERAICAIFFDVFFQYCHVLLKYSVLLRLSLPCYYLSYYDLHICCNLVSIYVCSSLYLAFFISPCSFFYSVPAMFVWHCFQLSVFSMQYLYSECSIQIMRRFYRLYAFSTVYSFIRCCRFRLATYSYFRTMLCLISRRLL